MTSLPIKIAVGIGILLISIGGIGLFNLAILHPVYITGAESATVASILWFEATITLLVGIAIFCLCLRP